MNKTAFLVSLDSGCWTIGSAGSSPQEQTVPVPAKGKPADAATEVAAALRASGYAGQGVCLGLPSRMVLAAQVESAGLPRKHRREALVYRLEEQLPAEAERFTADFLPPQAGRALGLAVWTAPVREVIDALAAAGVEVASVCPTSLLALWDAAQCKDLGSDYTLVSWPDHMDVFRMAGGMPVDWLWTSSQPEKLTRTLEAELLAHPPERPQAVLQLVGRLDGQLAAIIERDLPAALVKGTDEPASAAAARAAEKLLAGKGAGWVDLRAGELAAGGPWRRLGRWLPAAAVLGLLLLTVLAGAFLYRTWRYEALAQGYRNAHAAEYRRLYPNGPLPPNVKSRLRSEAARLSGVSGTGQDVPEQVNALDLLRQAISGLPPPVKLHLSEVRAGPGGVFLEGQALSHTDAASVAQALARAGLIVDPPRTEQLPKGVVAFTLSARPRPERSTAGGKP